MSQISKSRSSLLLELKLLAVAEQLFLRGARVPVAAALLPVKREKLMKLFTEVTGETPKTGPLPSDHHWYATTTYPMRIIQSSIMVEIYNRLRSSSKDALEAEIMISAYDLYLDHCKAINAESLLTFVRCWHLLQQIRINTLTTVPCVKCKGKYVVTVGKLYSKYECALCDRTASLRPQSYQKTEVLQIAA